MPDSVYAERVTPAGIARAQHFAEIAKMYSKSPGQLALLWCKDQPGITSPIIGPRTLTQLKELLPVLDWRLTEEQRSACDQINPPGGYVVNFHNTAGWMKTP
jgi:aryl-alcohol dehydrogenase-like predicted oxidoreductase